MKFIFLTLFVLSPLAQLKIARAEGFDYPELSVVPRASERLESEAAQEKNKGWQNHLPYLAPATMTFLSGAVLAGSGTKSDIKLSDTTSKVAPWVGMGVGAAWWAVSFGILNQMDFYDEGMAEISKLPAKTQREQLTRERRSEETIFRAGALARRLKWISLATHLGANAFMMAAAKDSSFSLYLAAASAVSAFTPILFPHRWETTECTYREYKKRIYAPVVGAAILTDPNGFIFSPGLTLSLRF